MARAFIGLGANLGERRRTIEAAVSALAENDAVEVIAVSTLRETEPQDMLDQSPFLNGAVLIDTSLSPRALLDFVLAIEADLGRVRDPAVRYGPRTIDLDILLYETVELVEPGLHVPHPRLHERRFALEPIAELDPDAAVPGRGTVRRMLHDLE